MDYSPPETTEYHSSSGMSELDNLSDSDWLDIASGQESEDHDNDSLSEAESELECGPLSQPLSRVSSAISIGSSRGEVEAWEGFVDHNGGEGAMTSRMASGMYPTPPGVAGSTESTPLDLIPDIVTDQDIAEDELVKEALDQSLTGTLDASRTSSPSSSRQSSNQSSVRDLRLSFPDPLNSPRDELQSSYQELTADEHEELKRDAVGGAEPVDPEPIQAPVTPDNHEAPAAKVDFQIHLYGASTKYKWTVVQDFLQKVADGSGQFLVNTLDPTSEKKPTRTAVFGQVNEDSKPLFSVVRIYDRTEDDTCPAIEVNAPIDCPSLGIIFLPANRLPVVDPHTAYFAVLASDYISNVIYNNDKALRNAAEDDWELLNISPEQALYLRTPVRSPVVNHHDIKYLNARQVYRALQSVLYEDVEAPKEAPFKGQATPANAAKVIALVSVLLGIAFNASSFRAPVPTPTTVNIITANSTWTSIASSRSPSVALSIHGRTELMASSPKDTAVTVYNPGITALSLTPEKALNPTKPPVSQPNDSKENKALPSGDSAPKGVVLLTAEPEVSTTSSAPNGEPQAAEQSAEKSDLRSDAATAAGLNFVNSLSDALGVTTKSIVKAVHEDGGDLMDSLDDFMAVIKTQTDDLIKQSKGKAKALHDQVQALGETIQSRNGKARVRAKALKQMGEEFLMSAGERVRERTHLAKVRARKIRESVEDADAWDYYYRAYDDWEVRLKPGRESRRCTRKRERGRGRRDDRFMETSYSDCNT